MIIVLIYTGSVASRYICYNFFQFHVSYLILAFINTTFEKMTRWVTSLNVINNCPAIIRCNNEQKFMVSRACVSESSNFSRICMSSKTAMHNQIATNRARLFHDR